MHIVATAGTEVARIVLHGKPLPRVEDTVRVGEWLRMGLMSKAKWLSGRNPGPAMPARDECVEDASQFDKDSPQAGIV